MTPDTVILDLDGTLVDSAYVHALAWKAAFRDVGLGVAASRLHRLIGMGGDKLVAAATSDAVETALGDELRSRHGHHLDALFTHITPTEGAAELLGALAEQGCSVVLASSSDRDLTERLLDLVPGADALLTDTLTGSDADRTKPDGQLIEAAVAAVDADRAVLIGDAVWDVEAARDAGIACIGVLTGGFSAAELRDAGAVDVVDHPGVLAERLRSGQSLVPAPR